MNDLVSMQYLEELDHLHVLMNKKATIITLVEKSERDLAQLDTKIAQSLHVIYSLEKQFLAVR